MSARKKGGAQCGNLAATGRSRATICFVLLALPESLSAFSGVSSTSTFHDWVPPSYRSNAHCTDRNGISSLWAKKKEESERNDDKNDIDGDEDYDDTEPTRDDNNLLDRLNPFNAGKSFRSTVGSALDFIQYGVPGSVSRLPPERRSIYLDDQLGLGDPYFDQSGVTSQDEDYRPEVLVVGASGELGRTLVKRLLVEGRVRVRVFVRDLFSSTLNKLGTGVTYCQGDLKDIESLEYAVTDVDKIVFCASGKRTVDSEESERAEQARAIDSDGLRNLIHAYCNVRFADYGNSQAAKRLLFKFKRKSDIDLFAIDGGSLDAGDSTNAAEDRQQIAQFDWRQNKFGKGIFTGKVERLGEASISSVRLRARDSADKGIDLRSGGYAGFVCRCCSDGAIYECFIRTEAFQRLGIEYVCEFRTAQKPIGDKDSNSSRLKWTTVRLEFIDFRPRMRQFDTSSDGDRSRMKQALAKNDIPRFDGSDIRQIGFRYRWRNNAWNAFYLSFDYIKVFRETVEPEFVYLSDANIPPAVNYGMLNHSLRRIVTGNSVSLVDQRREEGELTEEETYFKYLGEEMIKQSGLSYTIIRISGFNNVPGTDSSTVRLQKMNKDIRPVSRADLAQVIASALLEPNACNLVLYMTKAQQRGIKDGDTFQKFERLRQEKENAPFQ